MNLIENMEKDGFWHYCEVCGKKEHLNSKEAFEAGWDYPGLYGVYKDKTNYGFGEILPRTCGQCTMEKTIYVRLETEGIHINECKGKLKKTLNRIFSEPESLIKEE